MRCSRYRRLMTWHCVLTIFFYKSHKLFVFLLFSSITLGNGKSHKEIWTNCNKLFYACRLFEPVQSGCRQLMVLTTKCQVICGDSPSLQHIVGYTVWHMVSRIFELFNPNWHEQWQLEKCSSLAPPRVSNWCQFTPPKILGFKFSWQSLIQTGQGDKSITPHVN